VIHAATAWLGQFRDADGNGIMEFIPPGAPLKPGRWSPELNFLAFRSDRDADAPDLPAGTRLRITIQWREAHDPESMKRNIGNRSHRST